MMKVILEKKQLWMVLKTGIVGNSYISLEEENTIDNYLFDSGLDKNIEILDDLDNELGSDNIISKDDSQKEDHKKDIEEDDFLKNDNYKNEINSIEDNLLLNDAEKMDIEKL